MENKSHALVAGLFTIVLTIAAMLIGLWLNRDREDRVPYEMATRLSIAGLNPQAAVRYRGFEVGKVDEIIFDPKVPGQILVRMGVRPDTPVTKSTFGTLGYQGVTGIAYVQLDDDGSNPARLPSSEERVARIEMRPSLLDNLQTQGLAILVQTQEVARRVNALLSTDNQQVVLNAFGNIGKAAAEIETIPRQLRPTLAKLPALTSEMQTTIASFAKLSRDASILTGNLNAATTQLTAPDGPVAKLSGTVDQIEQEALPLAREARESVRNLNRTLDTLNDHPQSLLFGRPGAAPGPGESGFVVPAK